MGIYCSSEPKYDKRLDQFIGTDLWVLMQLPNGFNYYINLISRSGEDITFRYIEEGAFDRFVPTPSFYAETCINRRITNPYSWVRFSPIEPIEFVTTDEILELTEGADV